MPEVVLHAAALAEVLRSPAGAVGRGMLTKALLVESEAKRLCPVEHGRLRSAIRTVAGTESGHLVIYVVADTDYAIFVHDGTGIFGPAGTPITPKTAKILRFIPKGGQDYVFAHSVKGVPPRRFLWEALQTVIRRFF